MKNNRLLYGLLIVTLVALLFNLNSWGVLEASEARYAEISREMFRSGDLLHPTLLNIHHYHKPPITFWLTGLSFQLFGVNAFSARFFLQLSLVAQGGLVYAISQRLFATSESPPERLQTRSLLAAIIYLSFPLSLVGARNLTTDSFLTTFVLLVVYCMTAYYCQRRAWGIYGSALFIGLGFLTKGPAIFVVPFFFWGYLMLARRVDYRVPVKHFVIALLFCVSLGLSWYIVVAQQFPGLGDYFIGRQVVARVTDDQAFNRAKPSWYYPLILMTTTLPWGALWIVGLFRRDYKLFKIADIRQLSLYWLGLPFIIFALSSSKLMMYLLPMYPGIALILACILSSFATQDLKRLTQIFFYFYSVLGVLMLFGPLVVRLMGLAIDISFPMILSATFLLVIPIWAYQKFRQPKLRLGIMALSSVLAITLYGGYFLGANEMLVGGTRPIAQFIQAQGLQDQPVMVYGKLLPSLAFNLDRNIITISDEPEAHGVARETQFQTDDSWKQYWIYPDQPDSMRYWERLVASPSVLVMRGTLPENRSQLLQRYSQTQTIGPWTVFYTAVTP